MSNPIRDAILAAPIPTKTIEVPEWGVTLYLRALTGTTRMEFIDAIAANERAFEDYEADQALDEDERQGLDKVERFDHTALRLLFAMCNEDGTPVFSLDQYGELDKLPYPTMLYIYNEVKKLDARIDYDTLKKTSL